MKIRLRVFLLILVVSSESCSQGFSKKIRGEWLLKSAYESPDIIIFRSDKTYLVYNDNDFGGLEYTKESDIILDNKAVTAVTETGRWSYASVANLIILTERNFIVEDSEFNSYYGKERRLAFRLKKLTDQELVLSSLEKRDHHDTYLKNARYIKGNDEVFYREMTKKYAGKGAQSTEITLSGYETNLKLKYVFYKDPHQLVIEDRNGKELFNTNMTNGEKEVAIPLRGVTKLVFKVKSSKPNTKWKFSVEIY